MKQHTDKIFLVPPSWINLSPPTTIQTFTDARFKSVLENWIENCAQLVRLLSQLYYKYAPNKQDHFSKNKLSNGHNFHPHILPVLLHLINVLYGPFFVAVSVAYKKIIRFAGKVYFLSTHPRLSFPPPPPLPPLPPNQLRPSVEEFPLSGLNGSIMVLKLQDKRKSTMKF